MRPEITIDVRPGVDKIRYDCWVSRRYTTHDATLIFTRSRPAREQFKPPPCPEYSCGTQRRPPAVWASLVTLRRQGDAFASLLPRALMKRAHAPRKIAPPVDKLKLVTPYPKARATMNETTLSTLVPLGTPIVLHLYTG